MTIFFIIFGLSEFEFVFSYIGLITTGLFFLSNFSFIFLAANTAFDSNSNSLIFSSTRPGSISFTDVHIRTNGVLSAKSYLGSTAVSDNDCNGEVDYGEEIRDTDILFIIDWSGSMDDEISAVRTALNQFAQQFAAEEALQWGLICNDRWFAIMAGLMGLQLSSICNVGGL